MSLAQGSTVDTVERGSEYAELSRLIKQAGLLDRRKRYYGIRIALSLGALAATWVAFAFIGDSSWQLLTAVVLGLVFTQVAFIGHDAGHKQIFRNRKGNDAIGQLHGGLVGLSFGWWVGQHNRHHANPNHEELDPDVDIPVMAFTEGQARIKTGIVRWTTKYQAFLFFPLLVLEGWSLNWSSVRTVWRDEVPSRRTEALSLLAHHAVYFAAVFTVLSPWTAIGFILIHKAVWGFYMGCSFAPNHKGMPTLREGESMDFLRKQVLTSRNVKGSPWVDLLLGGLNYQIEHHLFPSMPMPNLRHAKPIVHDFCDRKGISYAECGLFQTYGEVIAHMHAVSAPLRAKDKDYATV